MCFKDRRQHVDPGAQLEKRLRLALVDELRLPGPQHLALRVARNPKLSGDPLNALAVLKLLETHPRDRLHTLHPRSLPKTAMISSNTGTGVATQREIPLNRDVTDVIHFVDAGGAIDNPLHAVDRPLGEIRIERSLRLDASGSPHLA